MLQLESHDEKVVELIKSRQIEVNAEKGLVFGCVRDVQNNRNQVGFKDKKGNYLFSSQYLGRQFMAYICRAVWLKVNGSVLKNRVVVHKNENLAHNWIGNLELQEYRGVWRHPRFWSEQEVSWLKENYSKKSYSQLATELGRSVKSVRHRIKKIHLPRKKGKNQTWTNADIEELIRMHAAKMTVEEISQKLNRSPSSIRLQATRKLGLFRNDKLLRTSFRGKSFYHSMKASLTRKTTKSQCCLCQYSRHIDLHHLDGDNKNHVIGNIASLCPNHHREVEHGDHPDAELFCQWWRIYSDGSCTETFDNRKEIQQYAG